MVTPGAIEGAPAAGHGAVERAAAAARRAGSGGRATEITPGVKPAPGMPTSHPGRRSHRDHAGERQACPEVKEHPEVARSAGTSPRSAGRGAKQAAADELRAAAAAETDPEVKAALINAPTRSRRPRSRRRPMALPASPWAPVVYGKKPVKKVYRKDGDAGAQVAKAAKKR